jgi:hypothetical protein
MIERVVLPRVYSKYTFCREILAKKKNNEPFVSRSVGNVCSLLFGRVDNSLVARFSET